MEKSDDRASGYYENQPNPGNLVSRLSLKVRREMFPESMKVSSHHYRLLGPVSNLFFYAR